MGLRFFKLLTLILVGLALSLLVWTAMPGPQASAQCGTQASSCKTCHEVQGKLRVNTKGDWHIQHSFGDFCVFCHAGNVKAGDKATAHQGMVKPLDDVSASCGACHESDCNVRADKYAKILGVTVGTGSGSSAPRGQTPLLPFVPQVAGVGDQSALPAQSPFTGSSASSGDTTADERTVNWGNVALAAMAFVLLFGGGGFVFWNERQRSASSDLNKLIVNRPDLGELMPMLVKADPQTVQVITRTLAERSKRA
jgi:cytochrome c553